MVGFTPTMPSCVGRRTIGALVGILLCASTEGRAEFRLDPQLREEQRVRNIMGNLHRNMILAEHNLSAAIKDRDNLRLRLVSEYLSFATAKLDISQHPCLDAVQGLHEAVIGAGFLLDPNVMTVKIDEDKTISLRPDVGSIKKWYEDGFAKYASNLSNCEEQASVRKTQRVIPDKFPRAN